MPEYQLISHRLCPYVQRAAIVFAEKCVEFERVDIDLSNKPDWFLRLSPLGKVPVLVVEEQGRREILFESAVIAEYLDEVLMPRLHPADPLAKARHRAWIEFASSILADIYGYYTAPDEQAFARKVEAIEAKFALLEDQLGDGPFFAGAGFGLVDAAFAPVFRYFDLFDRITQSDLTEGKPKLRAWRRALASRPSVQGAVAETYSEELRLFVRAKQSWLALLDVAKAA
ncbi:MAG: glutathione S-transferase family protein [Sphingosinicella sp.]|nr:glutathione S-transferase family protein [Sphingosinicella sp.]